MSCSFRRGYIRRSRSSALLAGAAVLLLAGPAPGQDSQWWTNQYGNRARLLGGAVIGSSSDLSAVYYNPGGLALVDQPDALLTGYVFELDNLTYAGTLLQNVELSSSRFSAVAGRRSDLLARSVRIHGGNHVQVRRTGPHRAVRPRPRRGR